jgi:microcystin-dependent protein
MIHHIPLPRTARTLGAALVFACLAGGLSPLRAQDAGAPYLGQIMLVAFNYAPVGWMECNGQLLSISQNQALFALLGTTYGGNGTTTFALPDLRGRVPVHASTQIVEGQTGGEEMHTLTAAEMPAHTHAFEVASTTGTVVPASGNVPARSADLSNEYSPAATATMNGAAVATAGGSQPHENRMPYATLKYIICLSGIFPSRN